MVVHIIPALLSDQRYSYFSKQFSILRVPSHEVFGHMTTTPGSVVPSCLLRSVTCITMAILSGTQPSGRFLGLFSPWMAQNPLSVI